MIHVLAHRGQRLRLRLYPRAKTKAPTIDKAAAPVLFQDHADAVVAAAAGKLALRIVDLALCNRFNTSILERFSRLGIRDWWLAGGCIVQTIWNMRSARSPEKAILDYDILYYSDDISRDAEDEVIREAARLFADLPVTLQVRNQSRVHLWYPEKYGVAVAPLTTARADSGHMGSPLIFDRHCEPRGRAAEQSKQASYGSLRPFGTRNDGQELRTIRTDRNLL